MKKTFIFLLLLFGTFSPSFACDICGCGNGGSFFGVLPQSHVRLMGFRHKHKSFDSHLNSANLKTREDFQSIELWGRLYPFKKTQLMFFAPFNFNQQTRIADQKTNSLKGLGDATILLHYNVVNTMTDTTKIRKWNSNLLVGGGIKLPLGSYDFDQASVEEVANPNFQLGTGSWDVPINVIYTIKNQKLGFNVNGTYKINSSNSNAYRFANRSSLALSAFQLLSVKSFIAMPLIGLYGETAPKDTQNGIANEFTGGGFVAANAGLDVYFGKTSVGINAQLPFLQNMSNGDLKLRNAFNVQFTRMF